MLALVPQWLVLRRLARRLRWWVPLTLGAAAVALVACSIAALLLGAAAWQLALASLPPLWLWLLVLLVVAAVVGFVAGVALGAVQLIAYRRHLGSWHGWLIASGVFLAIFAVPFGLLLFMAGQDLVAPVETCSSFGIGAWVGVGLAWGALYGALTGIPLAARSPGMAR